MLGGQRCCKPCKARAGRAPVCCGRDMEAVRRRLGDTAAEVMGRLSAASMESYSRAYPHLVRLHMLQVQPNSSESACNACLREDRHLHSKLLSACC